MKKLKENDIFVNISYPYPVHSMPPFRKYKTGNLKIQINFLKKF